MIEVRTFGSPVNQRFSGAEIFNGKVLKPIPSSRLVRSESRGITITRLDLRYADCEFFILKTNPRMQSLFGQA